MLEEEKREVWNAQLLQEIPAEKISCKCIGSFLCTFCHIADNLNVPCPGIRRDSIDKIVNISGKFKYSAVVTVQWPRG